MSSEVAGVDGLYLDLYSTSQTDLCYSLSIERFLSHEKQGEKKESNKTAECAYHAPYFAWQSENTDSKAWMVKQGCCNHWDCPKCGIVRAKSEYWRIVQGSAEVVKQGYTLYFITVTTRGADMSLEEAEKGYAVWTNRFLTNLRTKSRRRNTYWCYVQVTERQRRGHPHSHILATFEPLDIRDSEGEIFYGVKKQWDASDGNPRAEWHDALRSDELQSAVCDAGLGEQYDISEVRNIGAVSRYIGKYLFKSSMLTVWPKNWRRVRYSNNWPKFEQEVQSTAIPLIKREDWYNLATMAEVVKCVDNDTLKHVKEYLWAYPVKVV